MLFRSEQQYIFNIQLNFVPSLNQEQIREELVEHLNISGDKLVLNSRIFGLSFRLWEILCRMAGIDDRKKWGEVSRLNLNKLIELIASFELHGSGKTTFKEEFVTCGGISLKEIDFKSMQSKKYPGLFFAGEILDIDGVTGGFNFQAAWTTGFIAGSSAAGIHL